MAPASAAALPSPSVAFGKLRLRQVCEEHIVSGAVPGRHVALNTGALTLVQSWRAGNAPADAGVGARPEEIHQILDALIWAGAVVAVDGRPVTPPPRSQRERLRAVHLLASLLRHETLRWAARRLPSRWALAVSTAITRAALRRDGGISRAAQEKVRSGQLTGALATGAVIARHEHALARQDALVRLAYFGAAPKVSSFLARQVRVEGAELLRESAENRRTIVTGLHAGAFPLIPLWLMATQRHTVMFHYGASVSTQTVQEIFEPHQRDHAWGRISIFSSTSPRDVRQLVRALREGAIAVVLPDYTPAASGTNTDALRWIGWLARITGAGLIRADAAFPDESSSRYRLRFTRMPVPPPAAPEVEVDFATQVRDQLLESYRERAWEWAFLYTNRPN
jgi:lauroyl/myristoyl acyltransferase